MNFTDPSPALNGAPSQTISGVKMQSPTVDDANIKLSTQEVKELNPELAQKSVEDVKSQINASSSDLTKKVDDSKSGLSDTTKGLLIGAGTGAAIGALVGKGKGALIGAASGAVVGGVAGSLSDKAKETKAKADGLGKDWNPDKYDPQSLAGNDKYVNPKTGEIGSTSKLSNVAVTGLLTGAAGAGIGALAGGKKGALIGGVSGLAIGTGASLGGVTGGALVGAGLGGGIGAVVGNGKGALIGAASGAVVGAATVKLTSVEKDMPKPNIEVPENTPRIKTVKIQNPTNTKGVEDLLNSPNSTLG